MKEKQHSRFPNFIILVVLGFAAYFLILVFSAGAGFASRGGNLNAFSPHSIVNAGQNTGAIISIVGDKNSAEISMLPNNQQETRPDDGAWFGVLFWFVLLIGLIWYIRSRFKHYDMI